MSTDGGMTHLPWFFVGWLVIGWRFDGSCLTGDLRDGKESGLNDVIAGAEL
jgi:hypothetical protein